MKNSPTDDISFEERIIGISTASLVLMAKELELFIECGSIFDEDFRFTLQWFIGQKFDIAFVLAKYNFYESGVDYEEAKFMIECLEDGSEEIDDDKKIFLLRCLCNELYDLIAQYEQNLTSTFELSSSINKGNVEIM